MTDIYPAFSMFVSATATVLLFNNLLHVGLVFEKYPDHRAARATIIALALFIISGALLMSGISILFSDYLVSPGSIASISIARGTLLITAIVLWLDRHGS